MWEKFTMLLVIKKYFSTVDIVFEYDEMHLSYAVNSKNPAFFPEIYL